MNVADLGRTVFNSIPTGMKTTVAFSRVAVATYNAVTGVKTTTTTTASAACVVSPARGTGSDTFADMLAIRERYLTLTVEAKGLGSFVPRPNDKATVAGTTYTVVGVMPVRPDGTNAAAFEVTVQ